MARGHGKRSAQSSKKLSRQQEVLELRISGMSQTKIAAQLGVSQSQISLDLKAAFDKLQKEVDEEKLHFARLDVARLEEMLEALWPQVKLGDTKACATAIRVLERRSRLLGLDAPAKAQIEVTAAQTPDEIRNELEGILAARIMPSVN